MKTFISVLAIVSTLSLASASIDISLKQGMRGQEVTELQQFLNEKGFLVSSSSGFFGTLTLKAVKAYQLSVGLPTSGFVGLMTRTKINESFKVDVPTVVASSTVEDVKATSTPVEIVTPVIQYVYITVPTPLQSHVVEPVKEEVYYLDFTSIEDYHDYKGNLFGFNFTPRATLNGSPIKVDYCFLPSYGRYTKRSLMDGKVWFSYSSGDYTKRLTANEKGLVTCVLVNGREVSN